ncbi:SprB repeat-containing protein [Candidatus Dependentiae bacterium]|nr:SprB repeat-containing protein [Candidatus Dependentiae bacterium]
MKYSLIGTLLLSAATIMANPAHLKAQSGNLGSTCGAPSSSQTFLYIPNVEETASQTPAQQSSCQPFTLQVNAIPETCVGRGNGEVIVSISGPLTNYLIKIVGPVTIQRGIDPGPRFLLQPFPAGTYTIFITDSTGCTTEFPGAVVIGSPDPINIGAIPQSTTCRDSANGKLTVTITGGTKPYRSVTLSNSMTNRTIASPGSSVQFTNLLAGFYTLTVIDANGCRQTQNVTVPVPAPINVTFTTELNCPAGRGSITITAISGGTATYQAPYQVSIDGKDPVRNFTEKPLVFADLEEGAHTINVTDANGCITIIPLSIGNCPPRGYLARIELGQTIALAKQMSEAKKA